MERILYGVAKAITEHISFGERYHKVKKIYFTGVHTGDRLQVSVKEKNAIVPRMPAEIFPGHILIRVNEFDKVAVTPLEEWMKYLKDGTIRPDTTAPGLGEAREKLKYYSMPPRERHAYDEHLSTLMVQNDVLDSANFFLGGGIEGRMKGRAEGETKRVVARNLKSLNLPVEQIAQVTGLFPEEIENL